MSGTHKVVVMDQFAAQPEHAAGVAAQSALAHVSSAEHADSGVVLSEAPLMGLLQIRATQSLASVDAAMLEHVGIGLSDRLQSLSTKHYCLRWMSPDSWLLSCSLQEVYSIEQALRTSVTQHMGLVNVSGGYCVLLLSGVNARQVLMKSSSYDVHPDHFPPGKVINTTFAKTQATLRLIEVDQYELIVRRSYADYVWLWLQRAAAEYGLSVRALQH